jgi:hypothetical protein
MLPLAKQSLDEAPYKLSGAVAKLAGITFSHLSASYWIDNLGFITEGKLVAIFIKPSLGVFQLAGHFYFINKCQQVFWHHLHRAINKFSGAVVGELKKKKLLHQLYFPPSTWHHKTASKFSGAVAGEEEDFCKGSFHTHILYFVLSFALLYFYLHCFIKNPKKISILGSCYFFTLVHYVVL